MNSVLQLLLNCSEFNSTLKRYSKKESDIAFLITQLNDLRHETKKRIDAYFGSDFTEMKSH